MKPFLFLVAILVLIMGVRAWMSPKPGILVQKGLYPIQLDYQKGPKVVENAPVLLEFWGIHCPPCLESIPHLNKLYSQYRPRGLQIVGITSDSPADVRRFTQRLPIHYSIANDPGFKYTATLNVYGIPDALLLDSTGTIRWRGHPIELTPEIIESVLP